MQRLEYCLDAPSPRSPGVAGMLDHGAFLCPKEQGGTTMRGTPNAFGRAWELPGRPMSRPGGFRVCVA